MMSKKVSKKMNEDFCKALKIALVEKDVENAYKTLFEKLYPGCTNSPDRGDGLLRVPNDISAWYEFKYDCNLKNPDVRSSVILQHLCYLKKRVARGAFIAKAKLVGDKNEVFCIRTKALEKYLHREDIDLSLAPSSAAEENPSLVAEISEDKDIQPYIHDINEKFDFQTVIEELESISFDEPCIISMEPENMVGIYNWFEKNAIKGKKFGEGLVWTIDGAVECIVDIFFTHITAPNEIYVDEKKNILTYRGKPVKINRRNYNVFITRHRQKYTPSEQDALVANKDRIFEDIHRRRTGAFFTPQKWADDAFKMIAEQLGENFPDRYVLWGCAAGTGNLTRGHIFKEAYISTRDQGDIDTIKDRGYNKEATIFPYDFLSEIGSSGDFATTTGIEGVPPNLKKAFESGKKILFYDNFPFGKAGKDNCPKGAGKNIVNTAMLENKMGGCSAQLYAQFMWKILSLAELYPNQVYVALFSQSDFMTSASFKKFRSKWEKRFQLLDGMLFDAGNFSDVSSGWGISFTISGPKKVGDSNNKKILKLKEVNAEGRIEIIGTKEMYNADRNACNKWIREETKGKRFAEVLGCFNSGGNNVASSNRVVWICSRLLHRKMYIYEKEDNIREATHPIPIIPANFRKVAALFTARKLVKTNWINGQDEYIIPNTKHPDYEQWNNDAIALCLFNIASRQSSFRNIRDKGKDIPIENELFFMSNKEMRELSGNGIFDVLYQDTANFPKDRYVYNLLQTISLSDDVKRLLEMARDLIRKSMKRRETYHYNNDKYHLNAWDAGWVQLKPMLKKHYPEDYDRFVTAYKKFEDRMREGVYKFGFLRR